MTDKCDMASNQRVIDHLDEVVDSLRYRPVATTAMQMRQAADEIQRLWREHDEDIERMERAADKIERLTRERNEAIGQAEQWRVQAEGLDHDLSEAKAEIERLHGEVQGVQLGAEGMGWAPRRSHVETSCGHVGTQTVLACTQCGTVLETPNGLTDAAQLALGANAVETPRPQAPIARLIVPDGVSGGAPLQVELYAPGLPPGEHDLYCEPEAVAPMMRAQEPEPEVCACGHHSRYHYEDGRGYIRCRATADCNCGWRIHEDAPVDPQAVPPVRPAQETPASVSPWTRPSESLPARNVPVLLAWNLGTGLMYDVGKYTGKRWLETIPQKKNQEFIAPDYWCLIPPVTGDHP